LRSQRRVVRVRGIVQGVGFRPFVRTLAVGLGLTGSVRNDSEGVLADVTGTPQTLAEFCRLVRHDAPPLAVVTAVEWSETAPDPLASTGFTIDSSVGGTGRTLAPPDTATCRDCLRECTDPADRRYRHPFIACTNCGPRFTIIRSLPYDRPSTTMDRFEMCGACRAEYTDPADRRFHAQPVACHDCGPVLGYHRAGQPTASCEAALSAARVDLAAGAILAVKGIGGYHLACDATDPAAVARLRERKQRGDKPFAVLVGDIATARRFALVDEVETAELTGPRCPVVLVRRRPDPESAVAEHVAPGNADVGVMFPPSALHHLLLGLPDDPPGPIALVLTSGNLSGEPIVTGDAEAIDRLRGIADSWLAHDREILVPCDDSVTAVVLGEPAPIRRSRGWAPLPLELPPPLGQSPCPAMLATGGDLKTTIALADQGSVWLSAHLGDMDDLRTQQAATLARGHLEALLGVAPKHVVTDAHPGYRSRAWGRAAASPDWGTSQVQHHHAHIVAVMAEHGLPPGTTVVGIALDGTGYGGDGAIWGGEMLLASYREYERLAHLSYVPLAGGDAAVTRGYRMALAHLHAAGVPWQADLPCVTACPQAEARVMAHQLATGLGTVPTSSAGRLFDAVASILGICHESGFEAQAAMALEAAAARCQTWAIGYPLPALDGVWDCGSLVRAVVADLRSGAAVPVIAARFHTGLAGGIAAAAVTEAARAGVDTVALSGGVFANRLLTTITVTALREAGLRVLRHRLVPANDGGLALGQVAVAAAGWLIR